MSTPDRIDGPDDCGDCVNSMNIEEFANLKYRTVRVAEFVVTGPGEDLISACLQGLRRAFRRGVGKMKGGR